jgi:hypothetical protein
MDSIVRFDKYTKSYVPVICICITRTRALIAYVCTLFTISEGHARVNIRQPDFNRLFMIKNCIGRNAKARECAPLI